MALLSHRRRRDVAGPGAAAAEPTTQPGRSLAKGPVGLLGIAGIVAGLIGLIAGNRSFALHHVPHGAVPVHTLAGVGINGWTDLLFVAAGVALLLGAPAHVLAKGNAFLVACALGAAAIIAVIRGNGIFGIFAANHVTEIIWGAAAVVLLLLSMLPRVGRRTAVAAPVDPAYARRGAVAEPVATRDGEPVAARDGEYAEPGAARGGGYAEPGATRGGEYVDPNAPRGEGYAEGERPGGVEDPAAGVPVRRERFRISQDVADSEADASSTSSTRRI